MNSVCRATHGMTRSCPDPEHCIVLIRLQPVQEHLRPPPQREHEGLESEPPVEFARHRE